MSADTELSALLHETRRFPPPADFSAAANAQPDIYDHAAKDRVGFWAEQAGYLSWDRPWESGAELESTVCAMVRGWSAQCVGELRGSARRGWHR